MPAKKHNLIGNKYGFLLVVSSAGSRRVGKQTHAWWLARCDCGVELEVRASRLKEGSTRSCGHLSRTGGKVKHGMSRSKVYRVWQQIHQRCSNPNNRSFKNYGARGIKVCERWHTFDNFYKDMGSPPPKFTLDRVDNSGDYEPDNCEWVTYIDQANNRRTNVSITHKDKTMTLSQWARELNINENTLRTRYRRKIPVNELFHK